MVTFRPARPGRLADVPTFERGIGGAESNVACALACAGHSTRWLSRVGADGFGEHLVAAIAAHGVDTGAIQRDTARPTGIYFRTAGERAVSAERMPERTPKPAGGATGAAGGATTGGAAGGAAGELDVAADVAAEAEAAGDAAGGISGAAVADAAAEVVYYRAGSAASAMSPALVPREQAWSGRILHLSGITAALSAECLALMRDLTTRRPGRPLVSFDVNYRVGLWQGAGGPTVLAELARGSDLVFVGEDEAEAAWNLRGPDAVRDALPEPEVLVVKQGHKGATVYARQAEDGTDTVTFEPALRVDVVAHVGAGDAFAAGFLSGTLRGLPMAARLRHGHLMAAASLTVPGDLGTPPTRRHADRLAALDGVQWETLRLAPGWTTDDGARPTRVEVRTP
ncbi:sugar kinase [Streptomyces sp. KR80]|uniref:sugar kinase n=1 Tax=Streptomyces sp. KR80 TaxID=3457426 RepID=UPI003FD61A50